MAFNTCTPVLTSIWDTSLAPATSRKYYTLDGRVGRMIVLLKRRIFCTLESDPLIQSQVGEMHEWVDVGMIVLPNNRQSLCGRSTCIIRFIGEDARHLMIHSNKF